MNWQELAPKMRAISPLNLERALLWHPGGLDEWSLMDWMVATAGESGEVLNSLKKRKRVEQKISQKAGPQTLEAANLEVGIEVGDTYLYLDLDARRIGSSLDTCLAQVNGGFCDHLRLAPVPYKGLVLMAIMGELCQLAIEEHNTHKVNQSFEKKIGMAVAILYLIAEDCGLDLFDCVHSTFNRVSVREGFPQRL